jgi:hypothetical protein
MSETTLRGWKVGDIVSDGRRRGKIIAIDFLGLWIEVGPQKTLVVVARWAVPEKGTASGPLFDRGVA